ncbi:hypothetical protein DsansV1_C21g0168031 [Dioscorea sansibarensis]
MPSPGESASTLARPCRCDVVENVIEISAEVSKSVPQKRFKFSPGMVSLLSRAEMRGGDEVFCGCFKVNQGSCPFPQLQWNQRLGMIMVLNSKVHFRLHLLCHAVQVSGRVTFNDIPDQSSSWQHSKALLGLLD